VTAPLRIWAVSDGRAGMENQALGLAEAVAALVPAEVAAKRVGYRLGAGRLPAALNLAPRAFLRAPLGAPWPDLWIATGRATLPLSERVRRWSSGRTFVVQTQHPRRPLHRFDLVVPPAHDGLSGPNVFPIVGAPHRVTPERLARAAEPFAARLAPLPSPRAAILVGGRSKAFDLGPKRAARLSDEIAAAVRAAGGAVLVSFSRRTPTPARRAITERLSTVPGWVWDGTGENPYFAFLAAADMILVTEDSANMAVEAAATGKPVLRLRMDGGAAKFDRLHADLERLGAARPFAGRLETWSYPPLHETPRAAKAVLAAMASR
jgi:uncharacterized protein